MLVAVLQLTGQPAVRTPPVKYPQGGVTDPHETSPVNGANAVREPPLALNPFMSLNQLGLVIEFEGE